MFAGKQGMFFSLVAIYGLLYLISSAELKRRVVQAMSAEYSLLFMVSVLPGLIFLSGRNAHF